MDLLPGFQHAQCEVGGARIHYARGGSGAEAVLLLHGYPQTHVCWHHIAPALAERFTVVCPDLRGYGDSSKPPGLADHSNYAKRAMAQDMAELMTQLGFARFHLVGHDRGARVAHRLAADHAERVRTLTVMDVSPTLKMFESTDLAFATAYYHWFLMLQPAPLPEECLRGQVPNYILGRAGQGAFGAGLEAFAPAARAEYTRCFADPAAIHASCEDYRASGGIDLEHDRADREAGRKLAMPVLALWGANGVVGSMFDCLADWREVAHDVHGRALPCGHFLPEERPRETLAALQEFLAAY